MPRTRQAVAWMAFADAGDSAMLIASSDDDEGGSAMLIVSDDDEGGATLVQVDEPIRGAWANAGTHYDGKASEAAVMALLAASPRPPWVQAAAHVFGLPALGQRGSHGRPTSALQKRQRLELAHDCRGIDAVSEALRHLHLAGVLMMAPCVIASSECDAAARTWTSMFHPAVPLESWEMCRRETPTPGADVYVNGFPCTPFSTRRGDKSATFEDIKAQPFWATLAEITAAKHRAILLENVCGLLTKTYRGQRCIEVLKDEITKAAAGRYYISVVARVNPISFGEAFQRPRVFVRMVLRSECLAASELEFCHALEAADAAVARVAMGLPGATASAAARLAQAGLLAAARTQPEPASGFCPCCLPLLPGRPLPVCQQHGLGPDVLTRDRWVARHQQGWQKLRQRTASVVPIGADSDDDVLCDRPPRSYFTVACRLRLPADHYARTPRVRNLVELCAQELWALGEDPFRSEAALDVSQSYGRHALRTDGSLPTLATSSRIWLMKHAVILAPDALLSLMGFPEAAYRARLHLWADWELRRFVGNTMHPGAVGPMLASLLSLLRARAGLEGDE